MATLDMTRLVKVPTLGKGAHTNLRDGMCLMEAVAYVAGEPWSDHPACACPVITAFLVSWNDALPDDERDALLRPLITRIVGTRGGPDLEQRRSLMAADWLVRVHTPAWLRLAKLDAQAAALEALPEITDMAQCPSLMPSLEAARRDASAAWDAAGDAAKAAALAAASAAAWAVAWDAAWDAASAAARDAARDAAWDAASAGASAAAWAVARAAARDAARAVAWDAAWDAASAAARDAARDALQTTRLHLRQSALALVERMIAAV